VPAEPSSPQSAGARAAAAPSMPPRVKSALARYRVAAFIVGYALIVLCITIVLKYVFDVQQAVAIWGPIHGVLYIGYVLLAFGRHPGGAGGRRHPRRLVRRRAHRPPQGAGPAEGLTSARAGCVLPGERAAKGLELRGSAYC
jgi:hypothetical protein